MTQLTSHDSAAAQRRARRDFIRTHHPDAGGNRDDFVAGWPTSTSAESIRLDLAPHPVVVVPQPTWPVSLTTVVLRRMRRRHQAPRVR